MVLCSFLFCFLNLKFDQLENRIIITIIIIIIIMMMTMNKELHPRSDVDIKTTDKWYEHKPETVERTSNGSVEYAYSC